ncbi:MULTISPECIES: hypothetical protein [Streptomyces]|uniref:hypothetical protein n=1 Tax=Streptomyces TaxID=1883 RepID=UPI000AF92806|nr:MULTISPECIES: hypothetical protein [Streptomyces]
MPSSPPTDEAVRLLKTDLLAERQPLTDLDTEHAWRAFIRFGRRRFDTPNTADADGRCSSTGRIPSGLDHWAEEVSSRAAWATIGAFKPVSVRGAEEPV